MGSKALEVLEHFGFADTGIIRVALHYNEGIDMTTDEVESALIGTSAVFVGRTEYNHTAMFMSEAMYEEHEKLKREWGII